MLHIAPMGVKVRLLLVGTAPGVPPAMPSADNRRRASRGRSHCQCPDRPGTKAAASCGSTDRNASRTSARTSKWRALMPGPIQYINPTPGAMRVRNAATTASSTPAASPRHPAWAIPTADPSAAANSTGRQSAVSTAQTVPGRAVTAASAAGTAPQGTMSRSTTAAPCICRNQHGSAGKRLRPAAGDGSPPPHQACRQHGLARFSCRQRPAADTTCARGNHRPHTRRRTPHRRFELQCSCHYRLPALKADSSAAKSAGNGDSTLSNLPVMGWANSSFAACRACRRNAARAASCSASRPATSWRRPP